MRAKRRKGNYSFRQIWLGLTYLIISYPVVGQTQISLEEYETRNLVFSGHIGEGTAMPVTFCLNVENRSDGYLDWYSVSGWYQYDRRKKPIPLAGIYANQLTLYHFEREESADSVVNFRYGESDRYFIESMEGYHSIAHFREKISIEYEYGKFENSGIGGRTLKGEWTDGTKRLPLRVYCDDMAVLQYHSFLKVSHKGNDFHINLKELGLPLFYPGDHSIAGHNVVDGKLRIVLSYDRPSKSYALGHCGAGNESGFLWLELDEAGHLLAMEDYLMESCLLGVGYEPGYKDEGEERYIVTDREMQRFLNFNKETMELNWQQGG